MLGKAEASAPARKKGKREKVKKGKREKIASMPKECQVVINQSLHPGRHPPGNPLNYEKAYTSLASPRPAEPTQYPPTLQH
jgi:hypothetical protein